MLRRSERWQRLLRIAARLDHTGNPLLVGDCAKRPPLTIEQQIEHAAFWYLVSDERAMTAVHESRASRRTS